MYFEVSPKEDEEKEEEKSQVQLNLSDTHMRSATESPITSPGREDAVDTENSKVIIF